MRLSAIPEIDQLSSYEKILLVEDLWDSIVADEANVNIPQAHEKALDARFERYKSEPGKLLSLEALQR